MHHATISIALPLERKTRPPPSLAGDRIACHCFAPPHRRRIIAAARTSSPGSLIEAFKSEVVEIILAAFDFRGIFSPCPPQLGRGSAAGLNLFHSTPSFG